MANFTNKDLLDSGLLFEINRTVLHPLGISLGIDVDEITGEVGRLGLRQIDDKEGMIFSDEQIKECVVKISLFRTRPENIERYHLRRKALGYVVQPLEPVKLEDNGDPF